jgi:hypothetical protein
MRRLTFPLESPVREVFAHGLDLGSRPGRRALRARLERAEARGLLPARVYVSPRRFGWWADELEAAIARLPRSYAGFRPPSPAPAA